MKKLSIVSLVLYLVLVIISIMFYGTAFFIKNPLANRFVAVTIVIYLIFSIFSVVAFNKSVISDSDKYNMYLKSLGISILTAVILIVSLTPLKDFAIIKEISITTFLSFKFLLSAGLFLDLVIQLIKIYQFKKSIVRVDELNIYNSLSDKKDVETIKESDVLSIINNIFEDYDFLYVNNKKAVDPETAKRVKDIYVAKYK